MKLYGHHLSSCTRKVLITLAEKSMQARLITVDLFSGEHKTPDHLARQPFGVIPALDDDGFVVYESRAIIRYVDAKGSGPSLTPSSVRERALMDQWLSVDQAYVAPHTRALAQQRILRPHEGLAPEEGAVRAAESGLFQAFEVLETALADDRPYLTGASFSLADVSLAPHVASLPMISAEHLLAEKPALGAWWNRVRARPSVHGVVDAK